MKGKKKVELIFCDPADGVLTKTSDPFVTSIIRNRGSVKQTSTKMKTLTPVFNEEFELYVWLACGPLCDLLVVNRKKKTSKKNRFFFFC